MLLDLTCGRSASDPQRQHERLTLIRVRSSRKAGLALLLAMVLSGCAQPPAARPSESPITQAPLTAPPETPTVAPTPSATVAPTPAPTVARTPRPLPTTRLAGERLLPYYFAARGMFPILPPTPQIDFDEPADMDGDAWYRGLNAAGQPIFTVREDFVITPRTANHEIGHAYEDLLKRRMPGFDFRARYWSFRGFPGTWQDAAREAAGRTGMSQWIVLPGESWAEAFSVAAVGSGREKTLDYGKTIDPVAMRSFFQSLATTPLP
jgi:hypothetical protein